MPEALTDKRIAEFRHHLCRIATRQFAERGIDGVSMRGLAREAGYTATALYSYFRNKEEILAATRAAALGRLSERLEAAVSAEPRNGVHAAGRACVAFAFDEPAAYQLAFAPQQPPAQRYPELFEARQRLLGLFEGPLHDMPLDAEPSTLAGLLWAGIHGLILIHMPDQGEEEAGKLEELRYQMTERLLQSADNWGKRRKRGPTNPQFQLDL